MKRDNGELMKIKWKEEQGRDEVEIHIYYPEWNQETEYVKMQLQSAARCISGSDNGRKYTIPIYMIYYIESVDRKTFIYTKDRVYSTSQSLTELLSFFHQQEFMRISKYCIINLNYMDSIKMMSNSRLEALLKNGEQLVVSRTYLKALRERVEGTKE